MGWHAVPKLSLHCNFNTRLLHKPSLVRRGKKWGHNDKLNLKKIDINGDFIYLIFCKIIYGLSLYVYLIDFQCFCSRHQPGILLVRLKKNMDVQYKQSLNLRVLPVLIRSATLHVHCSVEWNTGKISQYRWISITEHWWILMKFIIDD